MADAPKILGTDSLRKAYPKLNSAIDNSNEALTKAVDADSKADQAVSTANTAETKADSVQTQFNQVVIEGDSSVEAAQARVDADGNSFTTLKDRLDDRDAQLAEKAQQTALEGTNLRIDELIINSGNANAEVTDAHVSTVKNKSFTTVRNRFEEIEKETLFQLKNLIKNGNFSEGATSWGGSAVISNGNATLNASGSLKGFHQFDLFTNNTKIGHKMFLSFDLVENSLNVNTFYVNNSAYSGSAFSASSFVSESPGRITRVLEASADGTNNALLFTINTTSTTGRVVLDNVLLIDLTEVFGVGKEPTLEEMDNILSYLPNKWFDGVLPSGRFATVLYDVLKNNKKELNETIDARTSKVSQTTSAVFPSFNDRIENVEKFSQTLNKTFGTDTMSKKVIRSQLPFRAVSHTIIDDFSDLASWTNGTNDTIDGENAKRLNSTGTEVGFSKVFTDKAFKQYIILPIEVSDINALESASLKLRVIGGSDTNSAKFEMISQLATGINYVILNKNEAMITGTMSWSLVDQILFTCKAKTGMNVAVKFGKIETYDMDALCSITFDDGHITHYTNAWGYMKTKNPPILGCDAIITDNIGVGNHLSEAQLRELIQAGWDIQSHTKNHKNLSTLSAAEVDYQLSRALEYLVGVGAGKGAYHIIPPYYGRNATVDNIVKKYATVQKWCDNKYNKLPVLDPYKINTFNITKDTTVDEVKGWIDTAIANQLWVAFTFHMITDTYNDYMYLNSNFRQIIDYLDLKKSEIKTVTMSKALYSM